jgi:hypothetical protein
MRITDPPVYRTIRRGSAVFVDWLSAVPVGVQSMVTIEYSLTGNDGPWAILAQDIPNNGRYQMSTDFPMQSGDVWLRATATSESQSARHIYGPFTVIDPK